MPLLALLGLTGCETTRTAVTAPDLSGIRASVARAGDLAGKGSALAVDVLKTGAKPGDARVKTVAQQLAQIHADMMATQKALIETQSKLDKLTKDYNEVLARLNVVEPKLALANSAIWKRNWIILGMGLAIAGYIALKLHPATRLFIP